MRVMPAVAVALAVAAVPAAAQRAPSPADATVFIRTIGSAHVDIDEDGVKRTADFAHVQIATGSGFVVSPSGYVLTNDHVVNTTEPYLVTNGGEKATVTVQLERIDVCFRPDSAVARGMSSPCFTASVAASDPALDLAVLFIGGSSLPYVALGDSDAVTAGLPADALGYPLGRDVEVGKAAAALDVVPDVTTTPGAVSALRADDAGKRRYLQVTNTLNPGNSGGPLVDRDGYAIGVIRMKLSDATGIGFAIPVSAVKDFLESHALDQSVPARRLRLGGFQLMHGKGLGLQLPEGFADTSPFRSRVENDAHEGGIALRIDRVLSPWTPKRIEQALLSSEAFEAAAMTARNVRIAARPGTQPALIGAAERTAGDPAEDVRMEYAVLQMGAEKLVARYVGPAEWMAFNESVLRESLASLQAQPLLAGALVPVEKLDWAAPAPASGRGIVTMPAGWVVEPGSPSRCPGLPEPGAAVSASPAQDFTVVVRAAVWPAGGADPDSAAAHCSSRRGSFGEASYSSGDTWLGTPYVVEGAFVRAGSSEVVQLEVVSTDQKSVYAHALLAAWVKKVGG